MAGEVTSVTVVENVLFNLTITEDDATVTTVQVPSEIATIEINAFDVNVDMNNAGSGLGVFKAKSIDTFTLRSISDDNKTIEIAFANNEDEIQIKIPDAGLSVPDDFTLNADSDDTANVKFVGSTVDISKAKLITELDANSQNITSAGTITATQGDITTVNATNLNSTNIDVDAGTIDTFTAVNLDATDIDATQGDITTVNSTNVNSTNLDVDTGTIDTLTSTTATIGTGDITTVNATDVNSTNATITTGGITTVNSTTINSTNVNSTNLDVDTGTIDDLTSVDIDATTGDITTVNSTDVNSTNLDVDTGTIDDLTVVTAEATDKFIGDIRGAIRFRAKAGEDLTKGQAVYISGVSGNTAVVSKAKADSASTMPAYGLVYADANNNANVEIVEFGNLTGLDTATDSLVLDKPVYISPTTAGAVTATRPTTATHLVQNIGLVQRVHASAGIIRVGGSGRTNDVPNTFSIEGDITTAADFQSLNATITNDLTVNQDVQIGSTLGVFGDATFNEDITQVQGKSATLPTLTSTTATITTGTITTGNISTANVGDLNVSNDVVVTGDLTVNGTTTTINTETLELADNNIVLNSNHTGTPTQDAGFTVERGTSDDAVFQWNESDDRFEVKVGTGYSGLKTSDLTTTNLTATQGDITTVNATDVNTTNADINGGTIDGTTIGATTSAAGTFTTLTTDNAQITGGSVAGVNITGLDDLSISGNLVVSQNTTTDNFTVTNTGVIAALTIGEYGGVTNQEGASMQVLENAGESDEEIILDFGFFNGASAASRLIKQKNLHVDEAVQLASESGNVKIGSNQVSDLIANQEVGNFRINPADIQMYYGAIDWAHVSNTWVDANVTINSDEKLVITGHKNTNYNGSGAQENTDGGIIIDAKDTSATGTEHGLVIKGGVTIEDTISSDLIPTTDLTYDLGSADKAWHSLYVGPGSLYIDGHKVLGSDASGQIDITTDDDQNLNISAGAAGTSGTITLSSAGNTTQINDTTVNLGPQIGGATVNINGTLEAPDLHVGDLELDATLINNTGTNANLEIRTNGTGYTHLNTADVYVGTLSNALKIDETTLDLIGATELTIKKDLKVEGQLEVQDIIKVNDGFTLTTFNPYAGSGLPATAMDLTIMGVGEEEGWAALGVRSRGEHAWGLTGFGIPNEPPRSIFALQAGRLDGSSDDYLNNNDPFAEIMFNPYSGYKTGLEWLTPSADIRAIATEDHSSSGMGTKLTISTTDNGNQAGATDATHTNATIEIQGTTISSSGTLVLDDAVEVTEDLTVGASGQTTTLGAYSLTSGYNVNGLQIDAGDTSWAIATFKEYEGGANKPIGGFTNPGLSTEVFGGTPSSPAALSSGKRVFAMTGTGAYDSTGNSPLTANIRILGVTTEQQSTTNRGAQIEFQTIPNASATPVISLRMQSNEVIIGDGGDGKLRSHNGTLILDDAVEVTGTLDVTGNATFDGNVTLGDANTDVITSTGKLKASNGFNNTVLDTSTANYLSGVLGIVETGDQAYVSDGNGGSPTMAFFDGSNWKKFHAPNDNISST
jgi:hypothetical protein